MERELFKSLSCEQRYMGRLDRKDKAHSYMQYFYDFSAVV